MKLFGVDGCRGGWVVAESDANLAPVSVYVVEDLTEVFTRVASNGGLLSIDMPIGLSAGPRRRCDLAARQFLGSRASSVFPVPCRCTLSAAAWQHYEEACRLNFAACGRRLSKQSHAILPKIAHVDSLMKSSMQKFVRESHPEVGFLTLNRNRALPSKHTVEGHRRRLRLLRAAGISIPRSNAPAGDVMDALACLTIAHKISRGAALRFPADGSEDRDAHGLLMEIWG